MCIIYIYCQKREIFIRIKKKKKERKNYATITPNKYKKKTI